MRVTIDLMKKSTQIIDLSNVINPRVGDDDLQLPLHIGYGDNLFDMRGKDVEFLSNDTNGNRIYVAGTCNTNTPGDNLYMGDLTFRFPAGTFKADGTYDPDKTMFRIVDKETQKVISSVNVKITVMKNAIEFDFDPDKTSYDSRLENMLHDFHDKGQTMLDEIKDLKNQANSNVSGDTATTANAAKKQADQNAGDISDLKGEVAGARGRFANMARREDAQDAAINQKESIVNANANYASLQQKDREQDSVLSQKANQNFITDYLSKMSLQPEGFENEAALLSKYPNGQSGIMVTVDTGHGWIWSNVQNKWVDFGVYQTPALDSELIKQIQDEQQKHDKQIAQNASDISDNRQQITANSNELIRLKSAGKLQDVHITDSNGNRITDKNGYKLTGKKWLITTDTTLSQNNIPADAAAVGQAIKDANKFDPSKFGIPVLYLYSYRIYELQDKNTTLKNMVSYSFPHFNASGMLKKFKVQGRTSAGLPEKNYTLTFDRDYIFLKEFGYQNKYVIKANYTDFSQSKNVVSARVWGKVRHQHDSLSAITNSDDEYLADAQGNHILGITDPQLAVGKNAGAVDGMPIAVMVNDEFWGLYTLNVPKDGYMAKMPAKSGYAIVSVGWSNLGHQVDTGNTSDFGDVEIEYCGSSSTAWVQSSFNQMLTALNSNYDDKSAFDAALRDYLDIDSAIDYYCYSVLIDNIDGINSNFLFQTFNGKKWYIAAYDLDETFGTTKDFNAILRANSNNPISDLQRGIKHFGMTFENTAKNSQVFAQLWKYHKDDIIKRTQNLIDTVMSAEEVSSMFLEFAQDIPLYLYMQDAKRWRNKPYTSIVNINQITNWYSQRVAWAQKVIDKNIQ